MFFICQVYLFLTVFAVGSIASNEKHDDSNNDGNYDNSFWTDDNKLNKHDNNCWIRFNSKKHFEVMDKLDERFADVRAEYQKAAQEDHFDDQMLAAMLKSRGMAEREIQRAGGDPARIPAGIHLGGLCMMRLPRSLLHIQGLIPPILRGDPCPTVGQRKGCDDEGIFKRFFHRLKLRNNTHFRVRWLRNDLENMTLHASLTLNDLHLLGSYDRSVTDKQPFIMYYTPTYGQLEFLLKNVQYTMEGRYRLLHDKLNIEIVVSEMDFDDVMMTYLNNVTADSIRLTRKNIDNIYRVKKDLDKWLKDYFNDYLMYFGIIGNKTNDRFLEYDKLKAIELNEYMDYVIDLLNQRIQEVKAESVVLPKFTIYAANGMELLLKDGDIRGLDSMYRRSVATSKKDNKIRKVESVVGFSNLKVTYEYEALLPGQPSKLNGVLILSANELTALMKLAIVKDSDSIDMRFEFLEQAKPESLTVEGSANRLISNFKYILEQHVLAIMSNLLVHYVTTLGTLTKCVPNLYPHESKEVESINSVDTSYHSNEDRNKRPVPVDQSDHQEPMQPETQSETEMKKSANEKNSQENNSQLKEPNDDITLMQKHSAEIELPSDEVQHKHKMHVKYTQNLTLQNID